MGLNYDLIVHREDETYGYMCEWGEEGSSPISIESNPPDIPVSTSTGITQAGGPFSARDASPPYPIEICNWQDGAGQLSYDSIEASPEGYRRSVNVDVTENGHFELGPRVFTFAETDMENVIYPALGTFWAGFNPSGSGNQDSVRFLVRYIVHPDAVIDENDTSVALDGGGTGLTDLGTGATDVDVTTDDYLYCPMHNEVMKVTGYNAGTVSFSRGDSGTTASAHSGCTDWYGYGWRVVTFDNDPYTPPAQHVTAFASDGKYIYASFTNLAGNNGTVWYGDRTTTWQRFNGDNNIVALEMAGGYLYGAQDLYSDVSTAGYFNTTSSNVYTAISLKGGVANGASTAGLTSVGNFAYWVVSDGASRSWVYKVQHSGEDTFEMVCELPKGFIATCALGHLGNLYVGGYIDNLDTTAGDRGFPRYEGMVYLVTSDNSASAIARFRTTYDADTTADTRVKGMSSGGPYLYILTNADTYVYDPQHGGWSHLYDTSTGSTVEVLNEDDWTDETAIPAFYWSSSAGQPTTTHSMTSSYTGWDGDSDGYVDDGVVEMSESANDVGWDSTDNGSFHIFKVNAKKMRKWTIAPPAFEKATIIVRVNKLHSQAGAVVICTGEKEARVAIKGVMNGSTVTDYQVGLGYMENPAGDQADYKYSWIGTVPAKTFTFTMTISKDGATLAVGGRAAKNVGWARLRNNTTPQVWWSVGWPGDSASDNYNERIQYNSINFTTKDAYTADYQLDAVTVATMKNIAHQQGVTLVPVPGTGWDYVYHREICPNGWLETSDSAFHLGSVEKYFTSAVVEHSPLQEGQKVTVTVVKDDVSGWTTVNEWERGATTYDGESLTTTTALINEKGKKVRVVVQIEDDDPDRLYVYRLRVFRITVKFFPVNSPHVHVYYLNCREGVQCRTGRDWGYDPESAIRHLFSAADSGEVVRIESMFTENVDKGLDTEGLQRARIESVKLYQGPADLKRYDKLCGTCQIKLRRVDE